jgi:putative MFS transporter
MTTLPNSRPHDVTMMEIGRRLDSLAVNRVHRRIVWAIGLGLFFDIYEIFLSGAIGTALKTELALAANELKLVLASAFLGMFFGAAFLGRLADVVGRKRAFMFNLTWFSAWSLIAAFSPDPWFLVVARFLAGVGVGAEYPVADSYLSEVLPRSDLGRLAAWAYTCSFVAVPFVGFLSLALTGRQIIGIDGWRILLAVGALGAVLVTMMRRGLPESPRWLAGVGRTQDAYQALEHIEASAPEAGTKEARPGIRRDQGAAAVARRCTPRARLRMSPYRERIGMLAIFHTFQTFGYYGFGTLAALVLVARGYDVTSSLLYTALSFVGYPVGSVVAIPLLKRFERKFLVIGSVAAMAMCGLLFATLHAVALIVVFGFLTTATSNVFSNVYHVYQAEIFPSDVRATAVGWTYSLSRLSSAALPFILIPVLDAHGAGAMFSVVLIALAITIGVVAIVGPRTTWRSLEEINPA